MKLLTRFPLHKGCHSTRIDNPSSPSATPSSSASASASLDEDIQALKRNKQITRSEEANFLAFQSFAYVELTDEGVDAEREAMLESGLRSEDLVLERAGIKNHLPEWRKRNTGHFNGQKG